MSIKYECPVCGDSRIRELQVGGITHRELTFYRPLEGGNIIAKNPPHYQPVGRRTTHFSCAGCGKPFPPRNLAELYSWVADHSIEVDDE